MSLGPPFDAGNQKLHLLLGGVTVLLLSFLVAVALLTADHSVGKSVTLHLLVRRSGQLYTGAEVHLAGQRIGELTAIRRYHPSEQDPAERRARGTQVELELRILRGPAGRLFHNSTFVARNPTLLSPAVIEVGPPDLGQDKGPPIADGDFLYGIDPPDLDQLLRRIYDSLTVILTEAQTLRPEWQEAAAAFVGLQRRISHLNNQGELDRIGLQGAKSLLLLRTLRHKLEAAGIKDAPERVSELSETLSPLLDKATLLVRRSELLQERAADFAQLFGPSGKRDLEKTLAGFRSAITSGNRTVEDAKYLIRYIDSGRGTLGGFHRDIQIFDELKEVHRILKQQTLKVIVKPRKPAK